MKRIRLMMAAACVAALCGVLTLPVAGASASDASIRGLIRAYGPEILVSEGHLVTALGKYKVTRNPTVVVTDLDHAIGVLRSLKRKIADQRAVATRVKEGKAKLVKGLDAVMIAYGHLKVAFGEKAGSPSAADENAKKAEAAVKRGRLDLAEGLKLLR
jgi:hypothetical protein